MSNQIKSAIIVLLTGACIAATIYFHHFVKTQVVFTHLFYIPIVIASLYRKYAGVLVAIALGVILIVSHKLSTLDIFLYDYLRSIMFVAISLVVTYISNKNREYSSKLQESEEYIELNKKLIEANEQLVIEKNRAENGELLLIELNNTRDKFFSIIAHDLKSPFNSIIGIADLLRKNYYNYDHLKVQGFIESIFTVSKKTYSLLENLLEWASLQTNTKVFFPETFNLNTLIFNSVDAFAESAKSKNISLSFSDDTIIELIADRNMISSVVRNLVGNAIKFTPNGGRIEVKALTENGFATVSVIDNGVGIDPESIKNLFSIAEKVNTLGTDKEPGTGLGLIISKEFVEKHGGSISVTSKVNEGSTFSFSIPLHKEYNVKD